MRLPLKYNMLVFVCYILFTGQACKKEEYVVVSANAEKPSSMSILTVTKKDINTFAVTFQIKADPAFAYDDYGLIISKNPIADVSDGRLYSFGTLTDASTKEESCVLDSLTAYTLYHMKVFAKRGNTTYVSTDKTLSTDGLKITNITASIPRSSKEGPFASRGETITLSTNITDDTQSTVESTVKIGGIKAKVVMDFSNTITVEIPDSLPTGKQSIEIDRKGISMVTSDTLNILEGVYTSLHDFPFDYRTYYGSCQIGNTGYMMGGSIYALSVPNGCFNDMLTYDISNDKWSMSQSSPYPKDWIIQHELFTINNKIYCLPGRDTITNSTDFPSSGRVFEFDPLTNQWTEKAPFPGARRFDLTIFVLNNNIYVFGGNGGGPLTDLWEYNTNSDTWIRKADFPGTSVIFSSTFSYNDKAYVFGGIFPQALVVNDFWEYDAQSDTWQQLPTNSDIHERYRSVSFTLGNKGYILGGTFVDYDAYGLTEIELHDSWQYDFDSKQWSRVSNFMPPPLPINFTSFYAKPTSFMKGGNAVIYDRGKMIQFDPN